MVENVVRSISARQAIAVANEWLVTYVGDRFAAGPPVTESRSDIWLVPIQYLYPNEGPLGSVGEIGVNSLTGEMSTHPSVEEIKERALELYRAKLGENSTVLPTRD